MNAVPMKFQQRWTYVRDDNKPGVFRIGCAWVEGGESHTTCVVNSVFREDVADYICRLHNARIDRGKRLGGRYFPDLSIATALKDAEQDPDLAELLDVADEILDRYGDGDQVTASILDRIEQSVVALQMRLRNEEGSA